MNRRVYKFRTNERYFMRKTLLTLVSVLALTACASGAPVAQTAATTPAPVAAATPAPATTPPVEATPAPVEEEQAEAPAPEEDPTSFKGDGWEISVPSVGWHRLRSPDPDHLVGLMNPMTKNLTILVVEDEVKLTSSGQRDFVVSKLLESHDSKLVPGSKKNVKSNGVTFASARVTAKDSSSPIKGWVWANVQSGKSATLICSGVEDSDKTQEKACTAIFQSLKLTNGQ